MVGEKIAQVQIKIVANFLQNVQDANEKNIIPKLYHNGK